MKTHTPHHLFQQLTTRNACRTTIHNLTALDTNLLFIDNACVSVCGSLRRISNGTLSVRLSIQSIQSVEWCSSVRGFAAVGPAGRRYRSIAARPALSSNCEQCYVISWRRKLNTDSLLLSFTVTVNTPTTASLSRPRTAVTTTTKRCFYWLKGIQQRQTPLQWPVV